MAEPVKTSGAPVGTAPTVAGPTVAPNDTNGPLRSLFDGINPNATNVATNGKDAATTKAVDKNKTSDMKTTGVKPLTALSPIVGVLGLVIALVLWHTNHMAAIIVGLIGLAILVLWFIARRAKKLAANSKNTKKPATRAPNQTQSQGRQRRGLFGWFSRRRQGPNSRRSGYGSNGSSNGGLGSHGGQSRQPWWRRGRHNPLNRDRRNGRNGSESGAQGRSRNDRSSPMGDGRSQRRGRSWWPFNRGNRGNRSPGSQGSRSSHSDGPGRSRSTDSSGSRRKWWPFGGGRSRHHSNSGGSGTPHGGGSHSGPGSGGGSHSRGGRTGRRRWYKPWSWFGDRNGSNSGSGNGGGGRPNGSSTDGTEGSSSNRRRRFRNVFGRLWGWQLYDPNEESVNGQYDPNRRNRFRDRWNAWRTRRQRGNINYAGFDHTATPEPTGPALHGPSLSLNPSTQAYTQPASSAVPAAAPVAHGGNGIMVHNGNQVSHAVGGRLEAATYSSGAANSHRSAVWHIMVANNLRAWAARLMNSDNPYHRASANNFAHMAAQANEVAQNDAKVAAIQMGEAQRAMGNTGQRSIGS